jgi:tetratricopeptide (TPR) repeat protein
MTKRWADSDLRFLKDNADKMDIQTLAERLGARIEEVEARLEKLGLATPEAAPSGRKISSMRELFRHSESARKEYEKGVAALQKKRFEEAEKHFRNLLEEFGDEKELVDRARLYLSVCERKRKPARAAGESDDPYYAALLEKNRGNYEAAIELLGKASRRNGDGDAAFLLACCYARMNDAENAIEHLKRAIAEDEMNRTRAARDSDFDELRERLEFQQLTAASA